MMADHDHYVKESSEEQPVAKITALFDSKSIKEGR
jgi:hypothetical protein